MSFLSDHDRVTGLLETRLEEHELVSNLRQ